MDGLAKDMDAKKWMGEIGEACIVGKNSLPARGTMSPHDTLRHARVE